ncbi:MAG: diguanylate cyclase [Chloroflexi bacterium]|nr:diguanylate cyclase [Chloroflexota bacterium]
MNWQAVLYLSPYILSAAISVWIGIYAWARRTLPGATPFALLALCEFEWTLTYIFQLIGSSLGAKLFWNNMQFLGAVLVPLGYLYFAEEYTGRGLNQPRRMRWMLGICAALVLGIIWTDSFHSLFRISPHLVFRTPFSELVFENGPAFAAYPVYAYSVMVVSTFLLVANFFSAQQIYRFQMSIVLVGVTIPWAVTMLAYFNLVPIKQHEITPIIFGISNLIIAMALFRYHLFDITPVARDLIVEKVKDAVLVIDDRMRVVDYNPAAGQLLDISRRSTPGYPHASEFPLLWKCLNDVGCGGVSSYEIDMELRGEEIYFECSVSPLYSEQGRPRGNVVILRNVTSRKLAEKELQLLAITDPLTGIYNRRHFFERAQYEIQRSRRYGKPLSVILFDVDEFKDVNDTFGHSTGDMVLMALAQRCQKGLRETDMLARFGGEEFIVLLPETDLPHACQTAERLRHSVEEMQVATWAGLAQVTISLGIASLEMPGDYSLDKLLDHADRALYYSKDKGRNCFHVWKGGTIRSEIA